MKKTLFALLCIALATSCSSVKNYNATLNQLISVEKLTADVDFTYAKIKKLHPKLYWYISKEKLDFKFDSLKKTITKPMTSLEFYKKLTPVVGEVRQGHMFVYPKVKKYTKAETAAIAKKGVGPFGQFEFEIFDNKMYVVKNKSYDKSLKVGTEVLTINNLKTSDLVSDFKTLFASDGFNTSFDNIIIGKRFASFYSNLFGVQDSLTYTFKKNDSIKTVLIQRKVVDSTKIDKKTVKSKPTKAEREKIKLEQKRKSLMGWDDTEKIFNRYLSFVEKDSSIAYIKINSFSKGNYSKFYAESFEKIKKTKSTSLILDIRGNTGGRLYEISDLYTYLADTSFVFIDKTEVTKKTSLLHTDYFGGAGLVGETLKLIFSPLYYGYQYFSVKKKDGKFYTNIKNKVQKTDKNAFSGKIYVLINGGCFSASSIISSNLKGSKRATFVGDETGGAFNGTVAGQMPLFKMPNSEVTFRVGLMATVPFHKTTVEGRGIFPDVAIMPTLQDRIVNNDPEYKWILDDINKNKPN